MKCFKKIIAFKQQIPVGGNCYNVTQECKNPCPRGANAS